MAMGKLKRMAIKRNRESFAFRLPAMLFLNPIDPDY
jgi:hypothetical protein